MSNSKKAKKKKHKKIVRKNARTKAEKRAGKPSQKKPLKKAKQPMTTNTHNTQEPPPEKPNKDKDKDPAEFSKDSATDSSALTAKTQDSETTINKQVETIRSLTNLKDFDAYIKELSASQANVTKMMGVLLPGHKSTRDLVQAIWEGLYAHYQEEDWKLSDFSSFSSTMQRLTSMQNQFDALEMRRLEFARDHKALTQFSHKAMEAIREHADTLSPEALEHIEAAINIL